MEMKYLSQQDNHDLCFPLVHVNGIVGLDVNPTVTVSAQDIPLSNEYLVNGSKARVVYYDNTVYVSADIQLTPTGMAYLQNGNTIEIEHSALNNTEDVVLDCITTIGGVMSDATGYIWTKDNHIYISATCKEKVFEADAANPGGVIESEVLRPLDRIVGNALSTTKSFAPIRPVIPNGYIEFTLPQRIESIILVIDSINPIEIETNHGRMEVDINNKNVYTIKVTNTTKDYMITVKGNISSVVYPRSATVLGIAIHDCVNLTWFSVKENKDKNTMTQNTSIQSFALYGKHKMYNLSHFLEGLSDLEIIDSFYTEEVTNLSSCFRDCKKIKSLPTNMQTGKVITANGMCNGCLSLSVVQKYDWSNLVDATYMFYKCRELISIDDMNTTSLVYADYMFGQCSMLTKITMDAQRVATTENTFIDCAEVMAIHMIGMSVTFDIQDTNLKNSAVIESLMQSVATAPYDKPAYLYLPQNIALYNFTNTFLKSVADKNWGFK